METELDANLKTWGNSYGILLPADVVRRLHMTPGMRMHVKLSFEPDPNDASRLPTWGLGGDYDVDAILDEETDG